MVTVATAGIGARPSGLDPRLRFWRLLPRESADGPPQLRSWDADEPAAFPPGRRDQRLRRQVVVHEPEPVKGQRLPARLGLPGGISTRCINSTSSHDVDRRGSETPAASTAMKRSSVPTSQKAMRALWAIQVFIERAVSISASGSWLSSASTTAPTLPGTYPPPVGGSHPSFPG
jgi:hypothetical protein